MTQREDAGGTAATPTSHPGLPGDRTARGTDPDRWPVALRRARQRVAAGPGADPLAPSVPG